MDFPELLFSKVALFYRNHERETQFLDDINNKAIWKNQYAHLSVTPFGTNLSVDGLNEEGLTASVLALNYLTQYPIYDELNSKPALGISDIIVYILGNFATVSEAIQELHKVQIIASLSTFLVEKRQGKPFELHAFMHDRNGNSAIIEFIKGKMKIYACKEHTVLTNSPAYKWQLKNADKYKDLTGGNREGFVVDDIEMIGSGLAGISGSFMSPDRFVRAKVFLRLCPEITTKEDAIESAVNIIENVKVPKGTSPSFTHWMVIRDSINLRYGIKFADGHPFGKSFDLAEMRNEISNKAMKFLD